MLLGVVRHVADVLRQIDERFVLDARARRATDDVQPVLLEAWNGAEALVRDVVEDLAADGDLFTFAFERKRQRYADGVADAPRNELFERNARLDHAVRRHPGLGDAEV